MSKNTRCWIIFTDLDSTLLNHEDYNYEAALPLLEILKQKQIPVIPVTSKTRQEVETLICDLGLKTPFVVENGSGIFIPKDYQQFPFPKGKKQDDYILKNLGFTYSEARQGLRQLGNALDKNLRGFGDLTEAEMKQLTNLPLDDIKQAKAREFTEPFVSPQDIPQEKIEETAKKIGFKVLVGGRFCHLMGKGAGKGRAVKWLLGQYQAANPASKITTVGLGDSPNDLEMLEVVDQPIIIPGKTGRAHPKLLEKGWDVAPFTAPEGWVAALENVLEPSLLATHC